ncbi:MAG: hypothetical protein BWY04_00976 [candidate division CPR1 bacterium ADurb.Bin160]|jgi:hypothetical protein|uniref:Uncharacterized protein n=1 Tax=candidate division CPR1 bacterium ADurb.Bin160 TaxID=1852826 RepID=A0A1V5ZLN2_9BACT|nr:MAG: hypothetical protein BWY04_00976 [candidate division CPR1 bacterium ADurb.Bin160]
MLVFDSDITKLVIMIMEFLMLLKDFHDYLLQQLEIMDAIMMGIQIQPHILVVTI